MPGIFVIRLGHQQHFHLGAIFISRVHAAVDLPTYGFRAGVMALAAGIPATLFAGAVADRFKANGFSRMTFGIILCLISVPLWFVVLFSNSFYAILPAAFLLLAAALGWVGAAGADVTEIAGVNLRGLGIAIFFFAVNIASYLIGSNLIGLISNHLGATAEPAMMRYAPARLPGRVSRRGLLPFRGQPHSRERFSNLILQTFR